MNERNRIKNLEAYCNVFLDNANDMITVHNEEMVCEYVNEEILFGILGYKMEDIKTVKDELKIMHPDDIKKSLEIFKSTINTGVGFGEVRVKHKEGYYKWLQYKAKVFVDKAGKKKIFSISRDISEQKDAIEALKKNEENFRYLYETAPSGLWSARIDDGIFIRVNLTAVKILGFKNVLDVINKISAVDFFTIEDRRRFVRNLRLNGEINDFEIILTDINGTEKDISVSAKIYEEKGVIEGVFVDISARIKMEESLKESQEMLQLVMDNIPQYIFWKDKNSVYKGCNKNYAKAVGLKDPKDIIGKTDYGLLWTKNQADNFREIDKKIMETDSAEFHVIETIINTKGNEIILDTNKIPIHNSEGNVAGIIGAYENITKKRTGEQRLKESEEKFRTIAEQALMGIFIIQDDLIKYVNQYMLDLMDYSLEEVRNWKTGEFLNVVHPEDRNLAKEQSSKKQQGLENVIAHYQVRLLKKNGEIIWVDNYSKPINYNGRPADLATMVDITEKVLSEKRIKESEERYRTLFDNTPFSIVIFDSNGTIIDFNSSTERLFGYKREELVGLHYSALSTYNKEQVPKIKERYEKLLSGELPDPIEIECIKKDGSKFWGLSKILSVKIGNKTYLQGMIQDITEKKDSEQKLRETEEKYKNMIEGLDLGFYQINWDGSILNFNPAFRRIMGYDETIDLSKINSRSFWKKDEDRKIFVKELLKNNHVENFIGLGKNYHGQELYLQMHSHLTRDKEGNPIRLEGTIADITEKFKLEQKLKRSELRYRNLFENSPFAIILLDTKAIIREVNPAVEKLSGYKKEELIGRTYANLSIIDQEFLPALLERTQKLSMEQPVPPIDIKLYKKDGTPIWIQFSSLPIKFGDELFIQTMGSDITDRKTAEILIKEEVDKLKELDQIRKDLISRVSHELKTPLIPVIGGAELLQHLYKNKFDSESLELIQMIEKGGKRLSKLVEKLLDVTRIEFNKFELEVQKTDLSEIIRNSAETMKYLIEKRKIQFNLVIPKEFYLEIDGNRIEQVVTNLLSNALKNTPPDGRVSLVLEKYDNWAILSVSDTGVGFTEEEMKKLFTRFGKIERYEEGLEYIEIDGSGLGLYISKQIVDLHGGKIWVESDGRNKGCIFKVRISIQ